MHNEDEDSLEYLKKLFHQMDRRADKLRRERGLFLCSLVKARYQKGWSQAELARQTGLQQSVISRIERAHGNPGLNTLLKIAKALDVNLVLE